MQNIIVYPASGCNIYKETFRILLLGLDVGQTYIWQAVHMVGHITSQFFGVGQRSEPA
jgi:hypothetical protein